MQHQKSSLPTSVFCATAPSDAPLLAQWETHLLPLQQAKQISLWSERHLIAGADRLQQINDHMDRAQVIVFLLSADFFASDECIELMERALKGSAHIVPLLAVPVDWKTSKLSHLACIPSDGTFVTNWKNQADALHTCVQDLRLLMELPTALPQTRQQTRVSVLQNQNRIRMLGRLRRSYSDLMDQSLQGVAWMELGLAQVPDAVQNATHLLLRVSNRAEQHLPPGTSITEAYDEAEHELLILGEPGAGKSTLLLDLARQLILRAEQDLTHPLPVILPLSSWAVKRPKLEDWIVEQLAQIYNVPRKLSEQWVQEDKILPLLDGLDEMEETARPACIVAINTYHRDHLTALVICSRTAEYQAAAERHRFALQRAVVVQPLIHEDVDSYLVQAGKPLAALRSTLKKNTALYDLATTPLMLNILILTYQGTSIRRLSTQNAQLQQQIWTDYLARMVERKGDRQRYPLDLTRSWLEWLAYQMRAHNQTVFYQEHVQPDWLGNREGRAYEWFGVRLPAMIIGVLVSLLIGMFFLSLSGWQYILQIGWFFIDLSQWCKFLQVITLGGMLGGLLCSIMSSDTPHTPVRTRRWRTALLTSLGIGLVLGFSQVGSVDANTGSAYNIWLSDLAVRWSPIRSIDMSSGYYATVSPAAMSPGYYAARSIYLLLAGYIYSATFSLSNFLLLSLLSASSRRTRPTPRLASGRWAALKRLIQQWHLQRALLITLLIGVSFGISFGVSIGVAGGVGLGANYGLSYGIASIVISVILERIQKAIHLTERVAWTWRNLRNRLFASAHLRLALLVTGYITIFVTLSEGLSEGLNYGLANVPFGQLGFDPRYSLSYGPAYGLSYGLAIGLLYWLLIGLYQSIEQERIENQDRRVPNQGIRQSFRNSLLLGLIIGIMIGGIGVLAFELREGLISELNVWLGNLGAFGYDYSGYNPDRVSYGLDYFWPLLITSSILFWTITGGLAVWRHYLIRFLLRRRGVFPWNVSRFLNDATRRVLLLRLGGGYRFIHRLFLEYFVSPRTPSLQEVSTGSTINDSPSAISRDSQISVAYRDENISSPESNEKKALNKTKLILILLITMTFIPSLISSVSIFNQVATANLIVEDELTSNIHGVPLGQSDTGVYSFQNGAYHVKATSDAYATVALLPYLSMKDKFIYTITVSEINGLDNSTDAKKVNTFGLLFRLSQPDNAHLSYYAFLINPNRAKPTYEFQKYDNSQKPQDPRTSLWTGDIGGEYHLDHNATNVISIAADSAHFAFNVNGKDIATKDDKSLISGQFGMIVNLRGTEIAFSHLLITYH